jgi:hypothetical protein
MTCREFQLKWHELLDREAVSSPDVHRESAVSGDSDRPQFDVPDCDQALLDHSSSCTACRQDDARYRVLRQALRAWHRRPIVTVDLADRILAAASFPSAARSSKAAAVRGWGRPRALIGLGAAAAAALIGIAFITIRTGTASRNRAAQAPASNLTGSAAQVGSVAVLDAGKNDWRVLHEAVAEATSATWELALSASEPAARLGQEVMNATSLGHEDGLARTEEQRVAAAASAGSRARSVESGLSIGVPSLLPITADPAIASAVLQGVGDHVAARVRPLSSTALRAFSFLLGPTMDQPEPRTNTPAAKGA